MGGQIYEPGGSGAISTGQAPAPPTTPPTAPPGGPTYIKIVVPNFNGAADHLPQMGSYLRLGAIEPDTTPGVATASFVVNGIDPTGEDLASLVTEFADDLRIRAVADNAEAAAFSQQNPTTTVPPNDIGAAGNLPPPEQLPPGTTANIPTDSTMSNFVQADQSQNGVFPGTLNNRLAETAVLHTKGGWRDHSDGNRITTTRGDKVEVIQGNYKMVILGRQVLNTTLGEDNYYDDWATGLDESGGLSDNQDQARGVNGVLAVDYTWDQDSDGRWAWTQKTVTGVYNTSATSVTGTTTQGNGRQIAYTWVDEVQSFTGGPDPAATGYLPPPPPPPAVGVNGIDELGNKRVNRIYNRTWVNVLDEATDAATSITETVTGKSVFQTTNFADEFSTTAKSYGAWSNTRMSGVEMSVVNAISTSIEYVDLSELRTEVDIALFITELKIAAGIISEFKIGPHLDFHVSNHIDWHNQSHVDMHVGPHLDMHTLVAEFSDVTMKLSDMYSHMSGAFNFI